MKRGLRIAALLALVASLLVPAASRAAFDPDMPGITYPASGAGYQTGSFNVVGYADPFVAIRVQLGTPPCPPAGCANGPLLGTTTADGFGNWGMPITVSEGPQRLYVFANNGVKDSVPLMHDFLVDFHAPAAPAFTAPAGNPTLTDDLVHIGGTSEAHARVVVVDEIDGLRPVLADASGSWSLDSPFTNGPHTISAYQEDHAHNVSPASAPVSFTVDIDVTPPAAPAILSPTHNSLNPPALSVSGTAEPLSMVSVLEDTYDGYIIYGSVPVDGTGNWSMPLTLLDAWHFVQAVATDDSGNTSARSPVRTFDVDAIAPAVHVFRPSGYIAGQIFFPGDAVSGTATDERGVKSIRVVYDDISGNTVADDAAVCSPCTWPYVAWHDSPANLLPGIYTVSAYAMDKVGNVSLADQIRLIVVA